MTAAGRRDAQWGLALTLIRSGRSRESRSHSEPALAYFEEVQDAFMIPWSEYMLAYADVEGGQYESARRRLKRALGMFRSARDLSGYSTILNCLATIDDRVGDRAGAARLSGAVAALDAVAGTGIKNVWNHDLGFDPSSLRDDPATCDAWREGEQMGVDAVVALVLEDVESITESR